MLLVLPRVVTTDSTYWVVCAAAYAAAVAAAVVAAGAAARIASALSWRSLLPYLVIYITGYMHCDI